MAKKKQSKKHKFKYSAPIASGKPIAPSMSTGVAVSDVHLSPKSLRTTFHNVVTQRDFSYVAVDLRRIGVLAVSLVLIEIVIWYFFGHTGLGNAVYSMVQVQ